MTSVEAAPPRGPADVVGWPVQMAARYRAEGFWRGTTLVDLFASAVRDNGSRTALVAGDRRWTYSELDARVTLLASSLPNLGIAPGDRVVVQLPNVPEFLVVLLALLRAGAQPVLALPALRFSEVSQICALTDASSIVVPDRHGGFDYRALADDVRTTVATLRQVLVVHGSGEVEPLLRPSASGDPPPLPPLDPGGTALFLLSGGTTGTPKLIPRTHDDYVYNVRRSAEVCGFGPDTVYLASLPMAHNFALGCPGVLGALHAGGTVVVAPSPSPPDAFPLVEREGVTATALVPPLALLWTDAASSAGRDLSSLRLVQVGGAKLAPEVARRVEPALGCRLQQVFGMAEGLVCFTALDDPDEHVVHTQGRPMSPADELRVVDAEGRDVEPGQVGELLTRGPYTIRGYYRAHEHNARAFTPDGFYRTGDLVRFTATGHVVVEGRAKDVINRGGEKVSAEEVEDHLLAHPGVADAAVVGLPDPVLGERTCACLVTRAAPLRLLDVRAYLRSRGLSEYKLPDRVELVDAFPRTAVGKLDKRALAADVAARLDTERRPT